MKFRKIIDDYFTFSRNERRGIIILMIIIFLLAVVNKTIYLFEKPSKIESQLIDSLKQLANSSNEIDKNEINELRLFYFNPNEIDSAAIDSLSIPSKLKRNIINYRNKGGKFFNANDLRKIYGMNDSVFKLILPYIIIENDDLKNDSPKSISYFPFNPNYASDSDFEKLGFSKMQISRIRNYQKIISKFNNANDFFKVYGITEKQKIELKQFLVFESEVGEAQPVDNSFVEKIELNTADSIKLKQLPGIGNKLSVRIVKYRDLLGGFASIDQLREVYGFKAETMATIESLVFADKSKLKKIDINFANEFELSKHPYINKLNAKKIVEFRSKYGMIKNYIVLRDSLVISAIDFDKLKPYFQ